jgi:hypothetical protein
MRRTHLRGQGNILKRLLVHVAGFNLGLAVSAWVGVGKQRRVQDGFAAEISDLLVGFMAWAGLLWLPLSCSGRLGPVPSSANSPTGTSFPELPRVPDAPAPRNALNALDTE